MAATYPLIFYLRWSLMNLRMHAESKYWLKTISFWVCLRRIRMRFTSHSPILDTDTFGSSCQKRYRTTPIIRQIVNIDYITGRHFWLTPSGLWHREFKCVWPIIGTPMDRKLYLSTFFYLESGAKAFSFVCVFVLNISWWGSILWTACHKGSLFLKIKEMLSPLYDL